jgi:putative transposase
MRVKATIVIGAVAPNPQPLLSFLRAYRDAVQYVVDRIWGMNRVPSVRQLHEMFYRELRSWGFRAHHVSEIYKRAKEIVKAAKKNRGRKPVLERLTARLHSYEYRLDLERKVLKVAVLNGSWVEVKLVGARRLQQFLAEGWKPKELLVSYRDCSFRVYVTLEKEVVERKPRTIMGVDINVDNVSYVVLDVSTGRIVTAGVIVFKGFRKALRLRKLAERLQKRFGRHWRFMKWSRRVHARWMRRTRNIVSDAAHRVANKLVEVADTYDSLITLENLKGLKRGASERSDRLAWLFTQFAYKRLQSFIEYKAAWRGLRTVYVSARGTSRTSPLGRVRHLNYRWVVLPNGVATTRDVVAAWNLALRGLTRMKGSPEGSTWSPDGPAVRG